MEPLDRRTPHPFRGSDAVREGRVTWDRLRGPDFVCTGPDVYAGAAAEQDLAMRIRSLGVWSNGRGVVAGPLAALGWGAECPWEDAEIVLAGHCRNPPEGVRARTDRLLPGEIAYRYGVPMTTPLRTAFDLARREPLVEAVAAVDSLAFRNRFGPEDLVALAQRHPGTRGLYAFRRVVELMCRWTESNMETRMRLLFVLRGIPAPIPQYQVRLRNGKYRRLDLAWPDVPPGRRRLGVEYDGPEHRTITGQNRDYFRDGDLDDLGWEILHIPSAPVLDERAADHLAERVARRLR